VTRSARTARGGLCRLLIPVSYWPHIGRQNHPAPFLDLVRDQFGEVGGRPAKSRTAQIGKPRLEFRIGDADVDFLVQFFDDFFWGAPWTTNAEPCTCLVTGQGFAESWNVWQYWRARRRRLCFGVGSRLGSAPGSVIGVQRNQHPRGVTVMPIGVIFRSAFTLFPHSRDRDRLRSSAGDHGCGGVRF
jgi:hypothetical protein